MIKLIVFFVFIILFIQGIRVYLSLFRFFKEKTSSKVSNNRVHISYIPPKQSKHIREGEYIEYEEVHSSA